MNPGSDEAIKAGCKCPVLDNAHGKGYMGVEGVFVYSELCGIHGHEFRLAVLGAELKRRENEAQP